MRAQNQMSNDGTEERRLRKSRRHEEQRERTGSDTCSRQRKAPLRIGGHPLGWLEKKLVYPQLQCYRLQITVEQLPTQDNS